MRFGVLNVLKFGVPLQISKRYRHFIAKTRGFETLRDLLAPEWTVKRLRAVSQLKNFDVVPITMCSTENEQLSVYERSQVPIKDIIIYGEMRNKLLRLTLE